MSTSTSHFALETTMEMEAPNGRPVEVAAVDLALDRTDGVLTEARFTFTVSPGDYARLLRESLFQLSPENRGPLAAGFVADGDVQVEARLDGSLLPQVTVLGEDILTIGPAFARLPGGSPLRATESWCALSVTKEVLRDAEGGSLREGYSTLHASRSAGLRLSILAIAQAGFEEAGLDWYETLDDDVIRTDVTGENGTWAIYAVAREQEGRCTLYAQAPWSTPSGCRAEMAETITRINYGLPVGNFEMDYSDGEVRFKTSVDVSGGRMTMALFEALLRRNMVAMDQYLPALEAVRDGRQSPEEAVRAVEEDA